jgi:hypothetical protein
MNTITLAAAVIGFLLGGLTVSVAAVLEDDSPEQPTHGTSQHESLGRLPSARCLWKIP